MSEGNAEKNQIDSVKAALAEAVKKLQRFINDGRWGKMIMLLAVMCILVSLAIAQTTIQQNVASYGTIKVLGVTAYSDSACTTKVTSIAWGTIVPGTSINKNIYVKNAGNAAGTLVMSYGNWTPSKAASFITFSWNCSNHVLASNAVTCAKLTLKVQSTITGVTDFSFSIAIQASG
jgi:hypothetical protein